MVPTEHWTKNLDSFQTNRPWTATMSIWTITAMSIYRRPLASSNRPSTTTNVTITSRSRPLRSGGIGRCRPNNNTITTTTTGNNTCPSPIRYRVRPSGRKRRPGALRLRPRRTDTSPIVQFINSNTTTDTTTTIRIILILILTFNNITTTTNNIRTIQRFGGEFLFKISVESFSIT